MNSARILVSGSSGPIGAALLPSLKAQGFAVTRLVRSSATGNDQIVWDPSRPLSPDLVSGFDAVIHLAGESIVGRWTDAKKRRILESRSPGHGPSGGSRGESVAAASRIHLSFRDWFLRQSRR